MILMRPSTGPQPPPSGLGHPPPGTMHGSLTELDSAMSDLPAPTEQRHRDSESAVVGRSNLRARAFSSASVRVASGQHVAKPVLAVGCGGAGDHGTASCNARLARWGSERACRNDFFLYKKTSMQHYFDKKAVNRCRFNSVVLIYWPVLVITVYKTKVYMPIVTCTW
jgi:hypothetical protein